MEYERTITTVVNSYVEPSVSRYLENLLKSLEGKAKHLRILRSDGGLSSVRLARRFPVSWVLSGPAGGVTGAVSIVANQTKYKNLITIDMGGTSTDVALVETALHVSAVRPKSVIWSSKRHPLMSAQSGQGADL